MQHQGVPLQPKFYVHQRPFSTPTLLRGNLTPRHISVAPYQDQHPVQCNPPTPPIPTQPARTFSTLSLLRPRSQCGAAAALHHSSANSHRLLPPPSPHAPSSSSTVPHQCQHPHHSHRDRPPHALTTSTFSTGGSSFPRLHFPSAGHAPGMRTLPAHAAAHLATSDMQQQRAAPHQDYMVS